ncbi:Stk1 family PASTA domain-containing Ser/Thr kinase [Actinomyces sp. zg-332]|uniref:Stk1 family PASTA domain-containing Ser/Thr kinase n=1 Tax=Actinomyces sp. zg-332 TaxID=2708340 RepID=UPI00142313BD|nr:Stk1 family PASTA domain-containing Ser/Thr kinase [Actinomyces sp. zg-332]QPK94178.1 Stk1 family PASTA domain-containing Ser/Thr kinase [Actinomyces sp. zg-332]
MVDKMPRLLANRYEVRELIGRGGMAEVYIGFDKRLSRTVAIKMLRVELARDAIFQTRFHREAQSAASLNHPTIVAVYDTGEEPAITGDGKEILVPYIVMEYVDGHTVKDLLADGQPVPINEAVEIVVGVLNALEYSHKAGLVHRDIKPGNVMLTRAGKIKVMDFGIARAMTDSQITMTQTDAVVGTAQYLSPEQAKGETVDARSDLYSTGCLLFELLTARPPFKGDTAVSVAYQHVSQLPPLPSSIKADIPSALDRVVLKALSKSREERYLNAAEMRNDILAAVGGHKVSAPPVGDATQMITAVDSDATSVMSATKVTPNWRDTGVSSFEPKHSEEEPKSNKMKWIWASIIALIVILGGVTTYLVLGNQAPSQIEEQVTVPKNLEGLKEDQVAEALKAAGLIMKVGKPVESATAPKDTFVSSSPAAGTKVKKGTVVTVRFSAGPNEKIMPDVSNMSQSDAIARLKSLGLELDSVVTQDSGKVEEGKVINTDPAPGSKVTKGMKFRLYVSSGRVAVPADLVGKSKDEVTKFLSDNGLNFEVVSVATNQEAPNTVLSISPSGVVSRGTVIKVVVATDPGPAAPNSGNGNSNGNGNGNGNNNNNNNGGNTGGSSSTSPN